MCLVFLDAERFSLSIDGGIYILMVFIRCFFLVFLFRVIGRLFDC